MQQHRKFLAGIQFLAVCASKKIFLLALNKRFFFFHFQQVCLDTSFLPFGVVVEVKFKLTAITNLQFFTAFLLLFLFLFYLIFKFIVNWNFNQKIGDLPLKKISCWGYDPLSEKDIDLCIMSSLQACPSTIEEPLLPNYSRLMNEHVRDEIINLYLPVLWRDLDVLGGTVTAIPNR